MSTHARIARVTEFGTVQSIYVHFDGYFGGGVGETLLVHYDTENKIIPLFELGDLSGLGSSPEKCVAYHRDRKEPWSQVRPQVYNSKEEWLAEEDWLEYNYLFEDGDWYYKSAKTSNAWQLAEL